MRRTILSCILILLTCVFACDSSLRPAVAQGRPDLVWMRGHHASGIKVLAYSPDGKLIASGSGSDDGWDFTARIWRVSDSMLLRTFNHTGYVTSLAFTPDSKGLLAADTAGTVEYRRVTDGALLHTWNQFGGSILSLTASPNSQTFATGTTDGNAQIWRLADGALLTTINAHKGDVASVAFSPDGQRLATGCGLTPEGHDTTAKIWRVADGALLRTFQGATTIGDQGFQVAFSSDNTRLLLAARGSSDAQPRVSDGTPAIWVWRIADGALLQSSYYSGGYRINNVAFALDGQSAVVARSYSGNGVSAFYIDCFRLTDSKVVWSQAGNSTILALSPDGKNIVLGVVDGGNNIGQMPILNASDGTLDHNLIPPVESGPINLFTLSPDGKTTATVAGHQILLRSASDGAALRRIPTDYGFSSIAFSPDSAVICGMYRGDIANQNGNYVSIWRVSDGTMLQTTIKGIEINSAGIAFTPDGKNILISDGKIQVYRISDGALLQSFGSAGQLTFSPDGRYLLATSIVDVRMYRTSDWSLVRSFGPFDFRHVLSTAFSADSTMLAVGGGYSRPDDSGADLFDVSTGKKLFDIPAHIGVTSCAFSPDGNVLMLGSGDATLSFWSTLDASRLISYSEETGKPGFDGFGGIGGIKNVAYSPDSKFVYYSRRDGGLCAALNPYRNTVIPNHGGNTGNVTVKVVTEPNFPLEEGTSVKLIADGQPDIVPISTTLDSNSNFVLTATFDLRGAPLGLRNVVISLPDGETRTYPQGFTIELGIAPQLWVDILGRGITSIGEQVPVHMFYGNSGNVDSLLNTLWTTFPSSIAWTLPTGQEPYSVDTTDDQTVVNFEIPLVSALSGQSQQIRLSAPTQVHGSYAIHAAVTSHTAVMRQLGPNIPVVSTGTGINQTDISGLRCATKEFIQGFAQYYGVQTGHRFQITAGSEADHHVRSSMDHMHGYKVDIQDDGCKTEQLDNFIAGISPPTIWGSNSDFEFVGIRGDGAPCYRIRRGCSAIFAREGPGFTSNGLPSNICGVGNHWDIFVPPSCGGALCDSTPFPIFVVFAADPNYLAGSLGYGMPQWVSCAQPLRYAVYFENEPEATAPAQQVTVTSHLDATKLDMTTVNLQNITFANQTVTPTLDVSLPVGKRQFNADVDLRPGRNLIVHINAVVDMLTGELTWHFTSLDPDTGLPPDNPLAGFLDPGQEGSVLFYVMPRSDLKTGTIVTNQASIKFDFNAWMDTNTWFNTIDNDKPISKVNTLAVMQSSLSFPVSWGGTDIGSGLRDFTVYVSDSGGPYTPWLTSTTDTKATFTGVGGHTYAFYSQARDNAYNLEDTHPQPDTVTQTPNIAIDVSSQVSVTRGGYRLNRSTGRFVQTVTLKNTSGNAITGPISLVLDGLSSNAILFNKTGVTSATTPTGSPYIAAQAGDMAAGASITVTLEFTNSDNSKGITYTNRVLAGSGQR